MDLLGNKIEQITVITKHIHQANEIPGVVASAVIPCDGTVEIGRLDAVNPPHTLVCK